MQRNVLEYLEATAPRLPDKVAFSNGTDHLTFAQLHRAARGIGTRLAREGLDHEPVVVFMEKHPRSVAAFFGVVYAGCFYVPLDMQMPLPRQLDELKSLGQHLRRQRFGAALLGHEELVAQVLAGVPAVQEGGLQNRVQGKGLLDAGGKDAASGLLLQILVAPDVVRVGVGVVDGGQPPPVGVQKLPDLPARVLVVSAVNETDVRAPQPHKADFGGALNVKAVFCDGDQFVHSIRSFSGPEDGPPGFVQYTRKSPPRRAGGRGRCFSPGRI